MSISFTSPWWSMSVRSWKCFFYRRNIWILKCINVITSAIQLIHWISFIASTMLWESESLLFLRFCFFSTGLSLLCTRTSTSICSNFLLEPTENFSPEADALLGCGRSLGFFFFTLRGFGPLGPFFFRVGWMEVDVLATDFNSGNVAWRVRSSF